MKVLKIGNISSSIFNQSNIFEEIPIIFNLIGVSECKKLCRDSDLYLVH